MYYQFLQCGCIVVFDVWRLLLQTTEEGERGERKRNEETSPILVFVSSFICHLRLFRNTYLLNLKVLFWSIRFLRSFSMLFCRISTPPPFMSWSCNVPFEVKNLFLVIDMKVQYVYCDFKFRIHTKNGMLKSKSILLHLHSFHNCVPPNLVVDV